ncbi:MAG: hypothetical protein VX278_09565, partial [Myxococcota bacterium]|nr:hypothetical protein [Myxococcota bacterium]
MRSLPFILPFMVACASDTTTKVFNNTPEITITSHDASIEIDERQSVDFIAQVSDANHLASELDVTWVKDGETICDWSAPSENGESLCSISFEDTDATVTVQARDPEGAAAMESVQVTIIPNEAPSASIISPIETGSYYSDEMIAFQAEVSDVENVPPDLEISWESNLDGELPLLSTADANGNVESAGYLSEGSHLIQLSVTDLSGKTTTDSVVVLVNGENSRPECSITEPTDGSAATLSEMVVFRGLATDTDIPSEELQIMWASDRDGDMGSGTVNSAGEVSLPFDTLTAGTHTISLQVSDEVGALCTDTIILSIGTPPVLNIATPIDGDLAEFGSSISFSATVSDNEDIPSQISVSWNSDLDGLISNQSPDSSGNINFTSASLRAGIHNILVTATDPAGLNTTETLSLRVNNSPTAPIVTISPTPAQTGDNLIAVASGSNDADGDNITYQFEWLQNGITTNNTSATILSADTTKGELWTVRVTPNDGFQNGNSTEQSITIANTPPVIDAVSISPANPTSSEILTCSGSASDLDGETLSESYSWENQNTGMVLGSGSSITLLPSAVAPGDVVTCTYQASDSDDSSSDTTSVTVENTAPEINNVHINPSTPYIGETLTCSVSASDPDVETLVETYTWTNSTSGSALGTGVTYTLIEGDALPNDTIVCSVEVQDAAGESATDTATASVQNQAPTIDAITLDQSVLRLGDTITCTATASDLDGETPTISYEWSNLTTQITLGVSASITLTNSMASSLDEIECVAVAEDGYGESDSASITISVEQNAPAFVVSAQITPDTGVKSNTALTCTGAALDPDGGLSSLAYLWENHTTGSTLGTGDTLTLDNSIAQPNDTISCTITATDSNQNTTDSSDSITVENTTPVITSLSLS